jgi:hypothetical protein
MRRGMGVLLVAAALALGACSSDGSVLETSAPQASATPAFLAQAAERTAAIDTGRVEIAMTMGDATAAVTGQFDTTRPAGSATVTMHGFDAGGEGILGGALGDLTVEVVYDDSTVYLKPGELGALFGGAAGTPWFKFDAGDSGLGDLGSGDFTLPSVTPDDLVAELRAEGIEVTEVGADEVRGVATTHYAVTVPADAAPVPTEAVDLDVWIDGDGLVRRVKIVATGDEAFTLDAELFDLGQPVTVTVPPDDQVMDLGDFEGLFGPKPR